MRAPLLLYLFFTTAILHVFGDCDIMKLSECGRQVSEQTAWSGAGSHVDQDCKMGSEMLKCFEMCTEEELVDWGLNYERDYILDQMKDKC